MPIKTEKPSATVRKESVHNVREFWNFNGDLLYVFDSDTSTTMHSRYESRSRYQSNSDCQRLLAKR